MMSAIKGLNILLNKSNICLKVNCNSFLINDLRFRDVLWQQTRHHRYWRAVTQRSPPKPVPTDPEVESQRTSLAESIIPSDSADLRFAFPEFLPKPVVGHRDKICEKLMRKDLIRRRTVLEIPEFYVGTILSVTISDPYAPGKCSKFVGICIERSGQGTEANFTLRNRVDGQGVEIRYDLYNPTIREIQVLKLEKRLDPHLRYLRDALPEYSTFPFDMTPEPLLPGQEVPINPIQVELKKWPWTAKWQYSEYKGIKQFSDLPDYQYINKWKQSNAYEKYDLMKEYREHIPEEDQLEIWREVKEHTQKMTEVRSVERRKKLLQQTGKKN